MPNLMEQQRHSWSFSPVVIGWLVIIGFLAALCGLPAFSSATLWYWETKGPFKNSTQVVDWEADGDLDVIVSHTRWEDLSIAWAGVGIWINRGDGTFDLTRDRGEGNYPFGGFAAGAGDIDQDGDLDLVTQDFAVRLHVDQVRLQDGQPGEFWSQSGINTPGAYRTGYRDAGGSIELGDLNGDGRTDAFMAGCCYGLDPTEPGDGFPYAPSISWVWVNEGMLKGLQKGLQKGHILPMDLLDGRPVRQAAMADLDRDGDLDVIAAVGKPTLGSSDMQGGLILLNDGTGRLKVYGQTLGDADSTSVALGDVNADGHLDVLLGTDSGASLWVNQSEAVGGGEPVFAPTEQSFEALQTVGDRLKRLGSRAADRLLGLYLPYGSIRTRAVFLEDLDGDGDLDALIARLWGAEIWWNDGQGEFSRSNVRLVYREDTGVAVADFDGDGDLDIFTGRNEDDYRLWRSDGTGGFAAD